MDGQTPINGNRRLRGGKAVVLGQTPSSEILTLLVGGEETSLLPVGEIPGAMGRWIVRNSQNALAAAAAIVRQVPPETIRNALRSPFATCDVIGARG
jgi:hypothetical protein